jgi:type III secretory pathway lipoprotein EscJ
MQAISSYLTDSEAQAARILLVGEGIEAEVQGEMIGMVWNNAFKLVVSDEDAERAMALLRGEDPFASGEEG